MESGKTTNNRKGVSMKKSEIKKLNKSGFSMIELAVGLLVLTVMTGIVLGGSSLVTKAQAQKESDNIVNLQTAAKAGLTATSLSYTGVTITTLKTGGQLPSSYNPTGTNAWGGNYTLAVNGTDAGKIDIGLTAVPTASATIIVANLSMQASCTNDTTAKTVICTF